MMIDISKRLLYYKRDDVREAISSYCTDKEVSIRFTTYFGKRPDVIQYPGEVLDLIKKGATSFHISEEHWFNPLDLKTGLNKNQLNELRKGWDLVLDIDCPNWEFSKLTTHLFIKALKNHGLKSITCKFSGNKGFHIGVPFKAFPNKIGNMLMKDWFPDGPKRITQYLLDYISKELIVQENNKIIFDNLYTYTFDQLSSMMNIKKEDMIFKKRCKKCGKEKEKKDITKYENLCPSCGSRYVSEKKENVAICKKCGSIMKTYSHKEDSCSVCGNDKFEETRDFNPLSIVEVDTILISSRHLYRSPYSMNEKSGLISIVIPLEDVLEFDKKKANPDNVIIDKSLIFLDDSKTNPNEGTELFIKAFDYNPEIKKRINEIPKIKKDFSVPTDAIPETLFPPCILNILKGLRDGRKRSLFILLNFLRSAGWEYDKIEELLNEWNSKNAESLREVMIKGHIRYHKTKKKTIPPPNCRQYYKDLGVCEPDSLCDRIKNPINYSIRKSGGTRNKKKKGGPRLTKEQKEMRRKHRADIKKKKEQRENN